MRINIKKIFKIVVIISFVLITFNIIVASAYNKFYLNGNNENNIKRSIIKLQNDDISDFENISVIKKIQLNEELVVIYKNKFNCGIAEFSKNKWGDYKINYLQSGSLEEINFYLTMHINNINQYFIVYGDGSNIEFSRVNVGINNNYVSVDIPEDVFVKIIDINQFSNGDNYSYTYKYYDKSGKLIEEQP
ncbi:hypothetical protein R0131_09000 [Clostridium sp. AL.422]|uniref:hypothetical protein n=1 Tax=Clostridium TaxID=1485 RepID=UPI00293DD7F9|nr:MULTISPECIES: hypothetical protein [unclassified Clostridium]MDV4150973.1 hypothetical protein [Clostridium sp. AL.422]